MAACGSGGSGDGGVLVYTRTLGHRHDDAIVAGSAVLAEKFRGRITITETLVGDLARYDGIVFLYTTGDVLDDIQQLAFESFVRDGGGFVGVHSATDTEYDWPFYGELVVAHFADHPGVQPAMMDIEDRTHPAMASIPDGRWIVDDEWYNFTRNPRDVAGVRVLATVDEASYVGGTMGADHPVVWAHERLGGRVFYTAIGHVADRWNDPVFVDHVVAGIRWAIKE